jgi:hypothetical protein
VGEPVSLSGDLHLILNITTDSSGGYHFVSKWNASYTGTGLISGATYKASESKQESWSASQLPASHHHLGRQANQQGRGPKRLPVHHHDHHDRRQRRCHGDRGQRVDRLQRLIPELPRTRSATC